MVDLPLSLAFVVELFVERGDDPFGNIHVNVHRINGHERR